jgi:hypothetical protein
MARRVVLAGALLLLFAPANLAAVLIINHGLFAWPTPGCADRRLASTHPASYGFVPITAPFAPGASNQTVRTSW